MQEAATTRSRAMVPTIICRVEAETITSMAEQDGINWKAGGQRHSARWPGDDLLDGGAGVDEARFSVPRSDVLLMSAANGEIVINFQSGEADIARQIEILRFDDALLVLVYEEVAGPLVHGLYHMAFARPPDETGFFYWQDQAREANLSAGDLVDIFAASPEFAARSLSDDHSNFHRRTLPQWPGARPRHGGQDFLAILSGCWNLEPGRGP